MCMSVRVRIGVYFLCVCVCVRVCVHVCVHVCVRVRLSAYMNMCTYALNIWNMQKTLCGTCR